MHLNFDKFIEVEHGYLLFPTPDERFKVLGEIYERTCAVIYLASKINSASTHDIPTNTVQAAFVRAALSEFVALEEFIDKEYIGIEAAAYKIYKTEDPVLHMTKLLRNYNIHVSSSELSKKSMMVRTIDENNAAFEINVAYISNLNFDSVRSLKSSKDYTDEQISKMIKVFNCQQHVFGVMTLLVKVALSYIERFEPFLHVAHRRNRL